MNSQEIPNARYRDQTSRFPALNKREANGARNIRGRCAKSAGSNLSSIEIQPLYSPRDGTGERYLEDLSSPGQFRSRASGAAIARTASGPGERLIVHALERCRTSRTAIYDCTVTKARDGKNSAAIHARSRRNGGMSPKSAVAFGQTVLALAFLAQRVDREESGRD